MMRATELYDDILLSSVEGIGARTYQRLVERFGGATAILNASLDELRHFEFVKPQAATNIVEARKTLDPQAVIDHCERHGIDIISFRDDRYPISLRTIIDPPPLLYVKGTLLARDTFSLAVVGTRRISVYGKRQTDRLIPPLVQHGLAIISGLAYGVDAAAHRATLYAGGRTIAVLGSGLSDIYPSDHIDLANEIVDKGGAVISEYPPLHPSAKYTFPQRNRIISGLSLGVLVVEAPLKSGTMITARTASEQGRDIYAVPGPIDAENSHGTHQLIRDGAFLVESADDIIETLSPLFRPVSVPNMPLPVRRPNETMLNEIEQLVLQTLDRHSYTIEEIAQVSELAHHQVQAALGILEEKCLVKRLGNADVLRFTRIGS